MNKNEQDFEIPNEISVNHDNIFLTQIKSWMTLQFTLFDFSNICSHLLKICISILMLQYHSSEIRGVCLMK